MAEKAISVRGLTKQFKVYDDVFVDRLKEKLFFWQASRYYKLFTALDDVNLDVNRGEVLGLIGPNGAGKTTFLKILSGISYPTAGEVSVQGSMVAVLALGLGFNMRFTGRENIVVGGCLLGMSLTEIREKEGWIIEFAELERFIDQPIRTYSSGMLARLSFAVAAAVSPDILIIDEALATGDVFFVQKSLGRIHEITRSGTTAVFVSHNLQQIQRLCSDRVVMLDRGQVVEDDVAHVVIKKYNDLLLEHREQDAVRQRALKQFGGSRSAGSTSSGRTVPRTESRTKPYFGSGEIVINRVYFTNGRGEDVAAARTGDELQIHLEYEAFRDKKDVRLVLVAENYSGIVAIGLRSDNYFDGGTNRLTEQLFDFRTGRGEIVFRFDPLLLTTNKYLVTLTLYDSGAIYDKESDFLDQTIFSQRHMAELNVIKPNDMNYSLVMEHPVTIQHRRAA